MILSWIATEGNSESMCGDTIGCAGHAETERQVGAGSTLYSPGTNSSNMFEHIAAWSSILGAALGLPSLIFSIRAFSEAKRAKLASNRAEERAGEAKAALRSFAAAEGLQRLGSRASEMLNFVESNRHEAACYLARELRFEVNQAITRWDFLENDTKVRLKKVSHRLRRIAEFLRGRVELTIEEKNRVLVECDETANALRAETGKIQSYVERH